MQLRPVLSALILALLVFAPASVRARQPDTADEPVTARAVARDAKVRPGARTVIAVELNHAERFHTWPNKGVTVPANVEPFAIRTSIALDPDGKNVKPLGIQWPDTHPGQVPNPDGGGALTSPLFSGRAIAYLTVELAKDAPAGPLQVAIGVSFQACDDKECFMPQDLTLPVSVEVDPVAAPGAPADPVVFAGYRPGEIGTPFESDPIQTTTEAPAPSLLGFTFGGGILALFLVAVLGGAVLNLTPCVLPVIPIKIMTLQQHAGHPARRIVLGLWMALGIVVFWAITGLPMMLVRSADPSQFIFGTWWVTLSIGAIIAAMGVGIMGLFTLQLPQSIYMVNPKADSAWGSFLFGVMTAVLGLPCFGFVAGGLLAGASVLPQSSIAAVFLGLGVGMAAPYLVLSIWPALIDRIPRTGPASELVKQVMGLLLLAAAAWFISAGIRALLTERPYLVGSISLWAVSVFVLAAGFWLMARILRIARSPVTKSIMCIVAIFGVTVAIGAAWSSAVTDREDWLRAQAGAGVDDSLVAGAWLDYNEPRLKKAIASGNIVVVDFTAHWCLTCKFLKRTVLDREPLRSRLQQSDAYLLEVDLSAKTAPGWAYLGSLGRTGVPTLAIYGPARERPVVLNAYTQDTVLNAIQEVGGSATTRAGQSAVKPPP